MIRRNHVSWLLLTMAIGCTRVVPNEPQLRFNQNGVRARLLALLPDPEGDETGPGGAPNSEATPLATSLGGESNERSLAPQRHQPSPLTLSAATHQTPLAPRAQMDSLGMESLGIAAGPPSPSLASRLTCANVLCREGKARARLGEFPGACGGMWRFARPVARRRSGDVPGWQRSSWR